MYIFLIVLIVIASILLVLAVLAQNPKGGMAANFGASNQVMGVRQTADFLERSTWTLAIAIVVLSLLASIAMSSHSRNLNGSNDAIIEQITTEQEIALPNATMPTATQPAVETTEAQPAEATQQQDVNIDIVEPEIIELHE